MLLDGVKLCLDDDDEELLLNASLLLVEAGLVEEAGAYVLREVLEAGLKPLADELRLYGAETETAAPVREVLVPDTLDVLVDAGPVKEASAEGLRVVEVVYLLLVTLPTWLSPDEDGAAPLVRVTLPADSPSPLVAVPADEAVLPVVRVTLVPLSLPFPETEPLLPEAYAASLLLASIAVDIEEELPPLEVPYPTELRLP